MTSNNEPANSNSDESILSDYYENYQDTQREILAIQLKKLRNVLFTLAMVIFLSDFFGLMMMNATFLPNILVILVLPVIMAGMAFLSAKEPLLSIIVAATVIVGAWVYTIIVIGATAAIMGWLIKALLIYFIIAGFQHAIEAMKIKKELKNS